MLKLLRPAQMTVLAFSVLVLFVERSIQQLTTEIYIPLRSGQHFLTKAVIDPPDSVGALPKVFAYGGWFKNLDATLRLNGASNPSTLTMNASMIGLVKYSIDPLQKVSLPQNYWTFITWVNSIGAATTSSSLLDTASVIRVFVPVSQMYVLSNSMPCAINNTEIAVNPLEMGDPGINGTSWFEVFPTLNVQQAVLFYAVAATEALMKYRMAQYMVGPYTGDVKYLRAQKFNSAIGGIKLFYLNGTGRGTNWAIMKELIDDSGAYIPPNNYLEFGTFFNPSADRLKDFSNVRTFYVQCRMRYNTSDNANIDNKVRVANHSWTTELYPPGSINSMPVLRINFTINRDLEKAWVKVYTVNDFYNYSYSQEVKVDVSVSKQNICYGMKLSIIGIQNATETNTSLPLANLLIEFSGRITGTEVLSYDNVYVGPIKLGFNPMNAMSVAIYNTYASNVPEWHFLFLESLSEMRGGFTFSETGLNLTTDPSLCHSVIGTLNGSSIESYCQQCTYAGIANESTGECEPQSSGTNETCTKNFTKGQCTTCGSSYFYSLTEMNCQPHNKTCDEDTHIFNTPIDKYNMRDDSCSDKKFINSSTNCTFFSDAKTTSPSCTCLISGCKVCMFTPCDECADGKFLSIYGKLRKCVSSIPAGFGNDVTEKNIKIIKPCMVGGCETCTLDHRICNVCSGTLKLDSVENTCVACLATAGRYYNPVSKTCSPCDFSCTTCNGTSTTSCLTCPLTVPASFLRISDNMCTACVSGTEYFTSGSLTYGVTQLATPLPKPTCLLCDATCKDCSGPGALQCTTCRADLFKYTSGKCGVCTEIGVYKSAPDCKTCHPDCLNCTGGSTTQCTACNVPTSYLYDTGVCAPCTPATQSFFVNGGRCKACHLSCKTCAGSMATGCTSCSSPLFLYSNSTCSGCTEQKFFQVDSNRTCQPCHSTCQTCSGSSPSQCLLCPAGKYLYPDNHCGNCTEFRYYGKNSTPPSCLSCDLSCLKCTGPSATECTACSYPSMLYLNSTCAPCLTAGPFYENKTSNKCSACHSSCKTCSGPAENNCLACPSPNYLTDDHLCVKCEEIGMFVLNNTYCKQCDANCLTCNVTATHCTECDTANGYILVNGTCKPDSTPLYLNCTATIPSSAQVGLSFVLLPNDTWSYKQLHDVFAGLNLTLIWKPVNKATSSFALASPGFQIDIAPPVLLPNQTSQKATLELVWVPVLMSENGTDYKLRAGACTGIYDFGPTFDQIRAAEKQAAVVSGLTSTMSSTDSAVGMSLMGTLLAADPTGTFFRFTKILQIVNKLYFININYGKRLEAFLAKTALAEGVKPGQGSINNINSYRGKLTQNKITLDFVAAMSDKVVLYLISWILKGVKRLLLDNCIMGKIGIYFCHYANRAHLIIFNLVFIDFIWLAPRTLMHARDLSAMKNCLPILVMCLIAADLCLILSHLLDDRIWRKALEHYTSLKEFCPIPETRSVKEPKLEPSQSLLLHEPGSAPKQDDPNQDQTKQINYKKTYFEIDFNVHLMDMATNTLRVDESVFQSKLCRLLATGIWLRANIIQLTILSCQYANTLGLTVLLIIELSRLFATIYAYLKYKYLKNIICFMMDISNSLALSLFFLNALLISPKRFDELIMDFYQDAGIWIVIASCVAEYLLLLTYIGVATYDFFKNRKMMKRMNVKHRSYDFIQLEYVKKQNEDFTEILNEKPVVIPVKKIRSRNLKKQKLKNGVRIRSIIEPVFASLKFKPSV